MPIVKKQENHFVISSLGNPSLDCYFHPDGDITFDFEHIVTIWGHKDVDILLLDLESLVEYAKQFVANRAPI
jgi:hypothetical protein